jgi:DDE superfamily endonuclease
MGRHGLLGSSSRFPTRLPRLALPLLRPPSRCSLRADRRHPNRRLCTLPVHLSLAAAHRRGWGSFYAALSNGRIDEGRLHSLLSGHPLGDGSLGDLPIYAVDVWVWSRSDAEASPGRGYYYPLRHSAGQPIVAGWAYQILAELGFERDSWVAPVDARRVRPAEDTDEAAAEQMRALMGQLPEPETVPSSSSMPSLRSGQTPACSGRRTGAMQTWVKVA